MKRTLLTAVAVLSLTGIGSSSHAQNVAACNSVRFSDALLSRFPEAPESCLDVVTRDGQQYAVIKARLEDVRGTSVRVRIKKPDGSYGPLTTIKTRPDRKVLIDGKAYSLTDVATDQDLTAYVRVDTPMIALAPAADTEPVEAVPLPAPAPERVADAGPPPSMPHTASSQGWLLLSGMGSLAAAFYLKMRGRKS